MDIIKKILTLDTKKMLSILHNRCALKIDNHIIHMMELEYYPWDDLYTHKNEKQREIGTIYMHRTGTSLSNGYKNGTWKGMDITCNGGILIRSIIIYTNGIPGSLIEGPCKSVDSIMESTGLDQSQLEKRIELVQCTWEKRSIPYYGARVGLNLPIADDLSEWMRQLILPMRSSLFIPTKKRETFFAVDIHRKDMKLLTRYSVEYEQGKYKTPSRELTILQVAGYLSTQ